MKAHICIGGPLDGEFATSKDFQGEWGEPGGFTEGMYDHLKLEYLRYNFGYADYRIKTPRPSMVWLHASLLKLPISPSQR